MGKYQKTYLDYIDKVQEKFPELNINEIKYIIKFGSTRLRRVCTMGMDGFLSFNLTPDYNFRLIIGRTLFSTKWHKYSYATKRLFNKVKYLLRLLKYNKNTNEYCYFGLTESSYIRFLNINIHPKYQNNPDAMYKKYTNSTINYGKVKLYRHLEECKVDSKKKHFFRVKFDMDNALFAKLDNLTISTAEYFLKRTFDGFNSPYKNLIIDIKDIKYKYDL